MPRCDLGLLSSMELLVVNEATDGAFAAVKHSGAVVTWGHRDRRTEKNKRGCSSTRWKGGLGEVRQCVPCCSSLPTLPMSQCHRTMVASLGEWSGSLRREWTPSSPASRPWPVVRISKGRRQWICEHEFAPPSLQL